MENNINQTYLNPNAIQDHSIHSDKLDSNSFKTINGQSIIGGPGEIVVGNDSPTNLNLIKDSNFESVSIDSKTSDPWQTQGSSRTTDINITYDYNKRCNVLKAQNINIRQYLSNLKPSTYYTLSFSFTENYYDLKSYIFLGLNLDYTSVTVSSSDISYSFSSTGTTITLKGSGRGNNECKKVSITFKTSTSLNDSPYIELQNTNSTTPTSGILEIDSIKLEEGQIATGYSKHDLDGASYYAVLSKQDELLSGTNIKTINGKSLLGKGNITVGLDNFKSFTIEKEDNSGNSVWVLISEITELQTKDSGGDTYGFTGMYNAHRDDGLSNEETGFIVARAYYQANQWTLKNTGSFATPYIVKYDPDFDPESEEEPSKYWIALKLKGPNKNIDFIGNYKNLLSTFIRIPSINENSLPENLYIVDKPSIYTMPGIGVNVQAVEAVGTIDTLEFDTCLKYTTQSLTDSQKEVSRTNIGVNQMYEWYQSLPEYTVTGHQKHLIGAGSYPLKSKPTDNTIAPNVFYDFGEVSGTLTVHLKAPEYTDITNEYMFQFKATSRTTLSIDQEVHWNKGNISIQPGYTYQISILNNLATYLEFLV